MDMNPEKMRAKFWKLKEQADAKRSKAEPLHAERAQMLAFVAKEEAKINKRIAAAEDGLFDLDQEIAMIARALCGRMGEHV